MFASCLSLPFTISLEALGSGASASLTIISLLSVQLLQHLRQVQSTGRREEGRKAKEGSEQGLEMLARGGEKREEGEEKNWGNKEEIGQVRWAEGH